MGARFWTYHRLYDDLLVVISMIALWRFSEGEAREGWWAMVAKALLLLAGIGLLAPGTWLRTQSVLGSAFRAGQATVWLLMLLALLVYGLRHERHGVKQRAGTI